MEPRTYSEKEIKEINAEMAEGSLAMIRETLVGLGIEMSACPAMFYPEAIKNLYVWTAFASRDCQRDHNWHGDDKKASAKCIHEGIQRYGKEKEDKDKKGKRK